MNAQQAAFKVFCTCTKWESWNTWDMSPEQKRIFNLFDKFDDLRFQDQAIENTHWDAFACIDADGRYGGGEI